jgi:hypothetical protein
MMNVFYHALNGVLLLWLLHRFSGALWPSAFVAAFFVLPSPPRGVRCLASGEKWMSCLPCFWMATLWLLCPLHGAAGWATLCPGPRYLCLGFCPSKCSCTLPFVLLLFDSGPWDASSPRQ